MQSPAAGPAVSIVQFVKGKFRTMQNRTGCSKTTPARSVTRDKRLVLQNIVLSETFLDRPKKGGIMISRLKRETSEK